VFSKPFPWPDAYVATVGVFDGLHLGHRAILDPVLAASREMGLPAVVFTFQPRPVTVFAPGTPHDELTPLPRKLRLIAELGIERLSILRFSKVFAQIEPEEFLTEILGAGSGLRGIWIGHDFRFGHRRRGDWDLLRRESVRLGFRAERVDAFIQDGAPVSSTRIREHLRAGEIESAARLLGRWPDLEGRVVSGRGQGRRVLVATANLRLPDTQCLPALGVYAGLAEWDGTCRTAVLNLGRRPTLTAGEEVVPEVHVLDTDQELLGRTLRFQIHARLRDERKFGSLGELRAQIETDIEQTRRLASGWSPQETELAPERED
jgi:riboflavin kinase/FMN adenylyltransferase